MSEAGFAALMAPLGPFGPAPRLAAGVSGGPHSLALALLADRWVRARGGSLLALIVDHGLRPESAAEAAGVAAMLAARGIAARILALGLPAGPRLQERARAARHAALLEACQAAGAPWLLLGHHRADQAETLLFRALRGSGEGGLAAMAVLRAEAAALVLRPLLGVPPARLEAVVADAGLAPVRDPSNRDPRFARIALRAALDDPAGTGLPVAALAEAASAFGLRRAQAEAALATRLAEAARLFPTGHAEIDPAALGADAVAVAALGALLRAVGGGGFPPAAAAVAALLRRGAGTLAGAWLRPRGARWLLLREPSGLAPPVPAVAGARWDGRFRLLRAGAPGHDLGALGPEGAAFRHLAPGLPAAVLAALPAIRQHAVLAAVPLLGYPDGQRCAEFPLVFSPAGGAVTGAEDRRSRMAH
ncbi:tRNA lysidine(34) synthetase TilS [Paracraurococcus lichenis]|uniref:tRNA(Ile)-lysidine synthase n=1 Tax=Paracraurococcus lichenis TaxID=3064888 RepID=A0ABT9DV70_9PROT|nr:tRNA lysidine(34) synthetase TilS [Paracraurococcus sp. LOR1-02]MDO9707797.1 tRNA lysidine(34) synthetase TilS [Paracraurococcus sp. LOR1-02]